MPGDIQSQAWWGSKQPFLGFWTLWGLDSMTCKAPFQPGAFYDLVYEKCGLI